MADDLEERVERAKQALLEGLNTIDERMEERIVSMQGEKYPKQLHHYTTINGLKGIVEGKTIWATYAGFLNDMSELSYGDSIVDWVMRSIESRKLKPMCRRFMYDEGLIRMISSSTGSFPSWIVGRNSSQSESSPRPMATYVACFCEASDLLSQWRGYGGAGGYTLDVDGGAIGKAAESAVLPGRTRLMKVFYDEEKQRQLVAELAFDFLDLITTAFEGIRTKRKSPQENLLRQLIGEFHIRVDHLLPLLKNPRFREESEWRIVHQRSPGEQEGIEFRTSGSLILPYVKVPFPIAQDSIASITCGPSTHGVLAMRSLEMYCKAKMPWVEMLGTDVTLRL